LLLALFIIEASALPGLFVRYVEFWQRLHFGVDFFSYISHNIIKSKHQTEIGIRKTFNKLLTKNKVKTTINIKRNSNETKLNNYTGDIEDRFLATINNKLLYDIVDDQKTLFELSNESLSKKLNGSSKTK